MALTVYGQRQKEEAIFIRLWFWLTKESFLADWLRVLSQAAVPFLPLTADVLIWVIGKNKKLNRTAMPNGLWPNLNHELGHLLRHCFKSKLYDKNKLKSDGSIWTSPSGHAGPDGTGPYSFHCQEGEVIAALWDQPHAVPSSLL